MPRIFPRIIFLTIPLLLSLFAMAQDENPCIENMSIEERQKIENVPEGKLIFNTTTGCLNYYHNKTWREFCETGKEEDASIDFDKASGKLRYNLNGQWYNFTMDSDNGSEGERENQQTMTSTSDLPVDCRRKPTRPFAGRDLVGFDVVQLEANQPLHGNGFWKIMEGEGGQFVDSTVPNTNFKGQQGITYFLRWTIATQCDTLFDDALVRIRTPCDPEPSQSFAGSDQFNVEEAQLNANIPRQGTGIWTIVSGLGGTLENPKNPRTKFRGQAGETYVLRWVIRNECGLTQDDIIVKIKPPCSPNPSQAYAGEDQIDVEKCQLRAERPQYGKGRWRILEGEGGKITAKDTFLTSFSGKPGETYVLQWTVATKCGSTADEVVIKFASFCPTEFHDFRDGKKYKSVRLAGQCWMSENLDYRPPDIKSYCYDGYPDYCNQFGALYDWNTAMAGKNKEKTQGVCPEGWHIPSDAEWQNLVDSSGFNGIELQLSGSSGFNIPMGGARYTNGAYLNRREYAYYWSSTSKDEQTAWNRYFPYKSPNTDHYSTDKRHSFSIRCVKDD